MKTLFLSLIFALTINLHGQDCQSLLNKVSLENTKLREMNLKLVTDYNKFLTYQTRNVKSDSILSLLSEINSKLDNRPYDFNTGFAVSYYQENFMDVSVLVYIKDNYIQVGYIGDNRWKVGFGQVFDNRWAGDINTSFSPDGGKLYFQSNLRYRIYEKLQFSVGADSKAGATIGIGYNI